MSHEVPQASTSEKVAKPLKQPKKRRWLRRSAWTLAVLSSLAFLANGIGARKVAHHYLNQSLEDLGMKGSVEIAGSIVSGFELKKLHYTGNEGIQSLSIDHAALDYQILELVDLKVDQLTVTQLKTEIDIAKFPSSENSEESQDWKETLKTLRPLILHPEILLEELDISILSDGKKLLHCELGSLQHVTKTDEIQLKRWKTSNTNNLSTPEQEVTLIWKEAGITSDRIQLLPELALGEIHFNWRDELTGNASVEYRDAVIDVSVTENATLSLIQGELKSAELFDTLSTFGIDTSSLDTDVVLNSSNLIIPTNDLLSPIPLWNITGSLGVKSARGETYSLTNTTLQLKQADKKYQLNIVGSVLNAPQKLDINGEWDKPSAEKWWEHSTASLSFHSQLNDDLIALLPALDTLPPELIINRSIVDGKLSAKLQSAQLISASSSIYLGGINVKEKPLPALGLRARFDDNILQVNLQPKDSTEFQLKGQVDLSKQTYTLGFQAKSNTEESPWLADLTEAFNSPVRLNKMLDITWSGSGDLSSNTHKGTLQTTDLTLSQAGVAPAVINLKGTYDYPNSVDIETLSTEQEELFAHTSLLWDGKQISIRNSEIKRDGDPIGRIQGTLPFSAEIANKEQFFAQTEPWNIQIDTEELQLKRIAELIPLSSDHVLSGTLQTKLTIQGSPRLPEIDGNIDIEALNDVLELGLDEISLHTKLATQDKKLTVEGNLLEADTQLVTLDLQLPFTPHQWMQDDNLLETIQKNSELKGSAEIKQLPLGRLTKLVPELKKLEGMLDAKAHFHGTIAEPKYTLEFQADLPILSLKNTGVDDITNVKIKGTLDQSMILNSEMDAKINGGKFSIITKVDINDPVAPVFDVKLVTDHALLYRDDVLAMRANVDLTLKGTLEDATVTGNIGILESLFYKDVDLIPIGVPTASVGSVSLPAIDTKARETLPIPTPFDQWKLDLTVDTVDPILIRGNVGSGKIEGKIKVRGVLAKPSLDGTLYTRKIKAKLPFSVLNVKEGKVIFKPNQGFIPTLEIRGKSQVGTHNVTLYAYGSADDPKLALSSYPALPENEIMTLLATGTTSSGLTDRDVATFKTLQILLLELKQRNDRPGGNKLFGKVLSGIDDLDLKVGEVNELTGEKYASATVKLNRRWFLTAQLDDSQPTQTRGLVIFALRFQ